MTTEIKDILKKLARFTYYEMENLEINDNHLKFDYISIILDIVCNCEISKNKIIIYVDDAELYDAIKSDDVIRDLGRFTNILDYINELEIGEIFIRRNTHGTYFDCTVGEISLYNLKKIVTIIDKILLSCYYVANNKGEINFSDTICIYPDNYIDINRICVYYIVGGGYGPCVGSVYGDKVKYAADRYSDKVIFNVNIYDCIDYACMLSVDDTKILYAVKYNKNLYKALNILKEIEIGNGIKLVLDKYTIRIFNSSNIKIECNLFYNNAWTEIEDDVVGKLIGDKCTLYQYVTLDDMYLVISEKTIKIVK